MDEFKRVVGYVINLTKAYNSCPPFIQRLKKAPYKEIGLFIGGAVAEWSNALQLWEKINENQKDPRFAPHLGTF